MGLTPRAWASSRMVTASMPRSAKRVWAAAHRRRRKSSTSSDDSTRGKKESSLTWSIAYNINLQRKQHRPERSSMDGEIRVNPFLTGNFAPVRSEDDFQLTVEGTLPAG